ncbi:hypothetical protein COU37_03645 [Candidatus Micrarchaeota archaeon CG10_big_fil_rev_8_21_14_0_10_45_29]|nr:MAG: hypothetical protein COU37_03645 [Candidatus Micrarchaeota archaeon CG10_big_fil_rev_8_21_14_0_10_45_29]
MLKPIFLASIALLLFSISFAYALDVQYAWGDGTTAPIECVEKCRGSGVLITEKIEGDVNYLSDACKSVCYETNAAATKARVQAISQNSAKNKEEGETVDMIETDVELAGGENEAKAREREWLGMQAEGPENGEAMMEQNEIENKAQNREEGNLKADGWENAKETLPSTANEMAVQNREEKNEREMQKEQFRQYITNSSNFEYAQMREKAQIIKITAQAIGANDDVVEASGKEIRAQLEGKQIKIRQEGQAVRIIDEDGTYADAPEATLEEGTLSVEGQEVKIMPAQAREKIKGRVQSMQMVQREGTVAYEAKVRVQAKIFGIFGTEYDKESFVDAQSGEILQESRPWWAFIAFE